ncbi:hypothetical protein WA158_002807 [Blastocystis sp. Blastoise]
MYIKIGRSGKLLSSDSKSMWNVTLSPGWNEKEIEVLRLAVMKYGIGSWKQIANANVLPGKNITQIVGQVQRLMGQQSLREFLKIHLDPYVVGKENAKRISVKRKNGMIVNDGNQMTTEESRLLHDRNKDLYSLSLQEVDNIIIPKLSITDTSNDMKIIEREALNRNNKLKQLSELRNTLNILLSSLHKRISPMTQKRKRRHYEYEFSDDDSFGDDE